MTETGGRQPGRPPRLSRDAVVSAALTIIDRDGIDALSMRSLARELGTAPMSIYRHVRDRDELLVLALDRAASELPRPSLPAEPRARLLAACQAMRDGLAAHPWVIDVLAAGDLIAPSILWLMEEIMAGFVGCDLTLAEAASGYRSVWQFTVGELIVSRGVDRVAALGRPPFVLEVLTNVSPDEHPTLAALAPHWRDARDRDSYATGLAALVDGLLARRKPNKQSPSWCRTEGKYRK